MKHTLSSQSGWKYLRGKIRSVKGNNPHLAAYCNVIVKFLACSDASLTHFA